MTRDEGSGMAGGALFAVAQDEALFLERAWAMEESARRAKTERALLPRLLDSVGAHVAVQGRNGTPLGALAMRTLLDGAGDDVLAAIARAASGWTVWQQRDFLAHHFDADDRAAIFGRLTEEFGMRAKADVDASGEVTPRSTPSVPRSAEQSLPRR